MKQHFIKTSDIDTKELLIKFGFKLVSENNGIFTFLNDSSKIALYDDKVKNMKFSYSNILCI